MLDEFWAPGFAGLRSGWLGARRGPAVIDGDAVIHELVLPAPAGQVFDMFTDPRQLIRWIGITADLEPQPGGQSV